MMNTLIFQPSTLNCDSILAYQVRKVLFCFTYPFQLPSGLSELKYWNPDKQIQNRNSSIAILDVNNKKQIYRAYLWNRYLLNIVPYPILIILKLGHAISTCALQHKSPSRLVLQPEQYIPFKSEVVHLKCSRTRELLHVWSRPCELNPKSVRRLGGWVYNASGSFKRIRKRWKLQLYKHTTSEALCSNNHLLLRKQKPTRS